MKKKPVPLSRPNSAGQKTPSEEMAMELKRKHDAVTDREIELRLHVRSKSCDPKQAKQVIIFISHYSLIIIYYTVFILVFSSRFECM